MNKSIYLDYAAATPVDEEVLAAMQPYFSEQFYNPSALSLASKRVKSVLERARADVAGVLGCRPAEVVFTAGATEANNLAIQGVGRRWPDSEILVSAIEHDSVRAPAGLFAAREIPVNPKGVVELEKLAKMINDKTVSVSVMYVSNELGSIQPLSEIAQLVEAERQRRRRSGNKRPLYLHSDAAQAGNFLSLNVARLGVDMMSLNGGKIYGPKQSGALYVKAGVRLKPLILGGGQEMNLRSGTENVPSIIGFAAALTKAQSLREEQQRRISRLRDEFIKQVTQRLPQAEINGKAKAMAPHIVNLQIPGTDNERLMMQLDEAGVICAVGSACSASSEEASHVLSAIGLGEAQARSSLRFSFGRPTTETDIVKTVKVLSSGI